MLIGHPPCTFLTSANTYITRGCSKYTADQAKQYQQEAIDFFLQMANCDIPKVVIENPIGIMSRHYRKPEQIIQPYHFGEDASKATCLWLKGVPPLKNTLFVAPRMVCKCGNIYAYSDSFGHGCDKCGDGNALPRWSNQTNSGQNRLAPSETRGKERSKTYRGISEAMASQWG